MAGAPAPIPEDRNHRTEVHPGSTAVECRKSLETLRRYGPVAGLNLDS